MKALHILTLFGFALAQPLLNLTSRNAEFFIVRSSRPVDLFFLVLILTVLLPGIAVLIIWSVGLLSKKASRGLYFVTFLFLTTALVSQLLTRLADFPGLYHSMAALLTGVLILAVYQRFGLVRTYLTYLSPSVLIFSVLFLFYSPVKRIVFPEEYTLSVNRVTARTPLVLIVFDELSVIDLMDEHRQIDPVRYPNFSALAQHSTWFRNATTVEDLTTYAVPAILTGNYPDSDLFPVVTDHPRNLFTLLGDSYHMKVLESRTRLCPDELCDNKISPLVERLESLLRDLSVLYLHIVLPRDLSEELRPIDQTWMHFAAQAEGTRQQVKDFKSFVGEIEDGGEPTLYFIHTLLPHRPYDFLPSGSTYSVGNFSVGAERGARDRWSSDEWAVIQNYQRHLLNDGFADVLLGMLLERLRQVDLYDRSLIVVIADHGVSFRPGDSRRTVTDTNFPDIMSVPLLIKAPEQREGRIDDRGLETIDILPTITDILQVAIPWETEGQSALGPDFRGRSEKWIHSWQPRPKGRVRRFNTSKFDSKYKSLDRKLAWFGSGSYSDEFYGFGSYRHLVGQRVSELAQRVAIEKSPVAIGLYQPELYIEVDPDGTFVPAHIRGYVYEGWEYSGHPLNLAVFVNGTIRATTQTYTFAEEKASDWSAMVSETAFQSGHNVIDVFVIRPLSNRFSLEHAYALPEALGSRNLALSSAPWIWGVKQSGFHDQEWWNHKPVRWTDGGARLDVPLPESGSISAVHVELASTGPRGTRLRIRLQGREVFDQSVPAGALNQVFDLSGSFLGEGLSIEFISDTFIPAQTEGGSSDTRQLGVAVGSVHLLEIADHAD